MRRFVILPDRPGASADQFETFHALAALAFEPPTLGKGMSMPFTPVFDAVKAHFSTSPSITRTVAMTQAATQAESWWKGEIIQLLGQLQTGGVVSSWDREVPTGKGREKVDFRIDVPGVDGLVEVKTALCAVQKGTPWRLPMYVMAPKSGYILTDLLKLNGLKAARRYLLVFAYAAPSVNEWQTVVAEAGRKAPGLSVRLARLDTTKGAELSIGWLEVQ